MSYSNPFLTDFQESDLKTKPNHCQCNAFLFPKVIPPVIMILFTILVATTATNPIVNMTEATAVAKFEIPGRKNEAGFSTLFYGNKSFRRVHAL